MSHFFSATCAPLILIFATSLMRLAIRHIQPTLCLQIIFLMFCSLTPEMGEAADGYKQYIDSLENVVKTQDDFDKKAKTLQKLGHIYLSIDRDSAVYFLKKSYDYAVMSKNYKAQSQSASDLCDAYSFSDQAKATEYGLLAIDLAKKADDPATLAEAYNAFGSFKMNTGNFEGTDTYFEQAIELAIEAGDSIGLTSHYNDFGILLMMTSKYDRGLEYWEKSLDLKLKMGRELQATSTMSNIATYYKDIGRYYEASEYLKDAVRIKTRYNDYYGLGSTYSILGEMYYQLENYPKSIVMYDSALYFMDTTKANIGILASTQGKAMAYESMGNYKFAMREWKRYARMYENYHDENKTRIASELEEKYETKQKEEENLRLQTANELKDARLEEEAARNELQATNNLYLMIGLILAGLVLFGIILALSRVRAAKRQVDKQKEIVEEKNKEITDSISYAKRIQEAILPSDNSINSVLADNFVLYMPKDIVAGDFYWMEELGNQVLIAVADCTGHGVPGAMVSVVCHNALNRSVREFGLTEPGEILDKTTDLVIETFEKSDRDVKDGMDIALCLIDFKNGSVKFSGANNSLYHLSQGELNSIPANKQPIGKFANRVPFETRSLSVNKGDVLYLFTDGYADQFGGEKGKKLKYKPFKQLLLQNHKEDMAKQCQSLEQFFIDWRGDYEQVDDICVIGIRI